MSTIASFVLSSSSASANEVKKLLQVMTALEPLCYFQDHPHPLVDSTIIASCFARVHPQSPGVGRFDIADSPNLHTIFICLFWHVLPEAAFKWDELFVNTDMSGLNSISRQCVHICPEGSQLVMTLSGSG